MSGGAKRVAGRLKLFGFAAVGLVVVVAWLVIDPPETDDSVTVAAPDARMSAETVAQLARASTVQGVCYGWQLTDGGSTVSEGSNLGPGTAVDSDPARCPRWVKVHASVWYTSASSEASDSASAGISAAGVTAPLETQLNRFGLGTGAFIDEPGWAICQAALMLPLLMAESGTVPPVPGTVGAAPASGATQAGAATPTAAVAGPGSQPAALPAAGSDFWRDRWGYLLGGVFLLLVAALVTTIGWFERKHQHRSTDQGRLTAKT